jgi:hypothetical protein
MWHPHLFASQCMTQCKLETCARHTFVYFFSKEVWASSSFLAMSDFDEKKLKTLEFFSSAKFREFAHFLTPTLIRNSPKRVIPFSIRVKLMAHKSKIDFSAILLYAAFDGKIVFAFLAHF